MKLLIPLMHFKKSSHLTDRFRCLLTENQSVGYLSKWREEIVNN
jgi:hypothetical protein